MVSLFLDGQTGLDCFHPQTALFSSGPVPYRIYVDSSVVMLCVFALAPASPLIAPAAFVYFLFCIPLLRWTAIFVYRPKFDMGGSRYSFIFDMAVSGMVVGQILLSAMMALKRAGGPAFFSAIAIIPTIFYRYIWRRRFLRAFTDAALLQTSLLVSLSFFHRNHSLFSRSPMMIPSICSHYVGRMGYK